MRGSVMIFFKLCCAFLIAGFIACQSCGLKPAAEKEPIGPNVDATLVIYFRAGITDDEVQRVENAILYTDRSDGRGKQILHNVRTVLQLLPTQANKHQAVALTFQPTATDEDVSAIRKAFSESPSVLKVFEKVAPDQIRPEDVPTDN
jgi:hypothetical protein